MATVDPHAAPVPSCCSITFGQPPVSRSVATAELGRRADRAGDETQRDVVAREARPAESEPAGQGQHMYSASRYASGSAGQSSARVTF